MARNWRKISLTWGKRFGIVLLVLFALGYGVLSLAQRSPDALRKGLEDYLTKGSGQRGEITDLTEARLIPYVRFHLKGVNIRDHQDLDKIYLHADSAYMAIPFWRMMFGSAYYAAMEVKGLQIATGYMLPKKLIVDFGGISDPDPQNAAPQFMVEGYYNDLPLLMTMEMQRKATRKGSLYGFAAKSMATFKLGKTEGEGLVTRHFASVSLDAARIEHDDMAAEFMAENIHERPLKSNIKGNINGESFNALLMEEGETIVLTITPVSADTGGAEAIKRFTDALLQDLGLNAADAKVRVVIHGLPENSTNQETPKDSKEQ